jgi:multimeric flavodoxin WrbA
MTENHKSAKNIIVLLGSPRKKGNSAILAQEIVKGAEAAGAVVETLFIHQMDIRPCQSCYACQKKDSKGCAIEDDMQTVYPKLAGADAWVIASPVYWFNMSAQTKLWLDRCFALGAYGQDAFNKKIAIAMAYGDADPLVSGCVNAIRTFQDCFRYVGAKIVGMVYGSALNAGEIQDNRALLESAEKLGRKLAR